MDTARTPTSLRYIIDTKKRNNITTMAGTTEQHEPASKDVSQEKDYWNNFYSRFNIAHPTQFCVMTAIEASERTHPIIEFGCGNGRDSIYFATHGFNVYGCDLSKDAIEKNIAKSKDVPSVDFLVVDASKSEEVEAVVKSAREKSNGSNNVTIYTRFFLHSIDEEQHNKFFTALSNVLIAGDIMYHEFRSKEDEALDKVHGKEHYRRYIDTPVMLKQLENLGFNVTYDITGRGMAKYKNEDPFVSRIVATKR